METTTMLLHGLKFVAFGALFIGITGYVVLRLWNWLVPELFKGPAIKFKHALGLMSLSFILFGGFRGHHGGRNWGGHHQGFYPDQHKCGSAQHKSIEN